MLLRLSLNVGSGSAGLGAALEDCPLHLEPGSHWPGFRGQCPGHHCIHAEWAEFLRTAEAISGHPTAL